MDWNQPKQHNQNHYVWIEFFFLLSSSVILPIVSTLRQTEYLAVGVQSVSYG